MAYMARVSELCVYPCAEQSFLESSFRGKSALFVYSGLNQVSCFPKITLLLLQDQTKQNPHSKSHYGISLIATMNAIIWNVLLDWIAPDSVSSARIRKHRPCSQTSYQCVHKGIEGTLPRQKIHDRVPICVSVSHDLSCLATVCIQESKCDEREQFTSCFRPCVAAVASMNLFIAFLFTYAQYDSCPQFSLDDDTDKILGPCEACSMDEIVNWLLTQDVFFFYATRSLCSLCICVSCDDILNNSETRLCRSTACHGAPNRVSNIAYR